MSESATLPTLTDDGSRTVVTERLNEAPVTCSLAGPRAVLWAVLLAAPLAFGSVSGWAWGGLALTASLLLVWWGALAVRQQTVTVVWSPVYIPAVLFLLLGFVQLLLGPTADPASTREAILKLSTDLVFFFVAAQLFATSPKKELHRLGVLVTTYTLLLSIFAILQYLSDPERLFWSITPRWQSWIFGPYVNHDHYAGLMELLIPFAATCWISMRSGERWKGLAAVSVLVAIASVLLSGSRGGLIVMGAEIVLFLIIIQTRAPKERPVRAAPVALGLLIAVLVFLWMDPGKIAKRLETVAHPSAPSEDSLREREVVSLDALRMLRDHLWLGTGLGAFEFAYPRYQGLPSNSVWNYAHDDIAQALAETGLAGGSLMALALALWFRNAFRRLSGRLQHRHGWMQLGAAIGCCGLLIHSVADFNLHIPANAAWLAVFAALAGTEMSDSSRIRPQRTCDPTLD